MKMIGSNYTSRYSGTVASTSWTIAAGIARVVVRISSRRKRFELFGPFLAPFIVVIAGVRRGTRCSSSFSQLTSLFVASDQTGRRRWRTDARSGRRSSSWLAMSVAAVDCCPNPQSGWFGRRHSRISPAGRFAVAATLGFLKDLVQDQLGRATHRMQDPIGWRQRRTAFAVDCRRHDVGWRSGGRRGCWRWGRCGGSRRCSSGTGQSGPLARHWRC